MSIASELTKLETDITNAYDAINTKGGTIPINKNTNNLATAISSISGGGGGKPEQSKTAIPSTSSQTILPDEGYTLSSVTINAVDNSIDNNIVSENIKSGITILGITGTLNNIVKTYSSVSQMQAETDLIDGMYGIVTQSKSVEDYVDIDYNATVNTQTGFDKLRILDSFSTDSSITTTKFQYILPFPLSAPEGTITINSSSAQIIVNDLLSVDYTSVDGINYILDSVSGTSYDSNTKIATFSNHYCTGKFKGEPEPIYENEFSYFLKPVEKGTVIKEIPNDLYQYSNNTWNLLIKLSNLQSKNITINGAYKATDDNADGYSEVTVNVSGEDAVIEKDVNFYDYDGTLVDSYTSSEFANLSSLPDNPTHEGLTAQGWNWTLSNAKTYVNNYGKLDIGQNYVTSDGKTKLYVEIQEYKKHVYVGFGINGSATIDWGDGTTSTLSGTSTSTVVYAEHTYSQSGDYVITIQSSATINIFGTSSVGSYLFTRKSSAVNQNRGTLNSVKKIELGNNITIGAYAFSFMPSLKTITMPSVSAIGTNTFLYCNSLKFCVIPKGITSVPNSMFQTDDTLEGVSLSETCSAIGNYGFYECSKLKRITIASGITLLGSNVFQNCSSLEEVIVSNTVTSLGSSCFNGCHVLEFTIPSTVTSLGTYSFSSNNKVKGFVVPSNVHTIPANCFPTCVSAAYFIFLGNITSIGASAFFQNASVEFYDFTNCTSVPTLSNANAFTGINYSKIVVPDSLYDSWIIASNWSNYASNIIKESDWNAS